MKKILFFTILIFTTINYAQLTVKDQEVSPNTLLQVNDEGTSGSITIPALSSIGTNTYKLYNLSGSLYWNGSALGTAGNAGGWTHSGTSIYQTTLTDNIGIGVNSPLSVLQIRTKSNWGPTVGLGWGDFSISNGSVGFSIGVAEGGGGSGDTRMWTRGGTERLMIGSATEGDVLSIENGNVGIGTITPGSKLEVAGQVKITGGTPASGKVLTSDANGLATWEDNANPKVGFSAKLSISITPVSGTDTQLLDFLETFDDGSNFNPTTGVFTIPVTGVYQFSLRANWSSTTTLSDIPTSLRLKVNGNIFQQFVHKVQITSAWPTDTFVSGIVKANAGDQITFYIKYASGTPISVSGGSGGSGITNVSGFRIY